MTAVEYLINALLGEHTNVWEAEIKTALEMEKQQIIDAAIWMPKPFDKATFLPELGKQYYNETYGKGGAK